MKNLVKYTQNTNAVNDLWNNDNIIIIGVSGGPDSMCLLDVMAHIAKKENLTIIVAHVNYGLRGQDSMDDEKLVRDVSKKHDFVCEIKNNKDIFSGNEASWRTIRYDFFKKLQKKYSAHIIAVGHTKNDQAETLLLHLLRGSGLSGLSGMQIKSQKGVARPFLGVSRDCIIKYCEEHSLQFNIDITNESDKYMRNKVRNNLLPYLQKEFNPQIIDTLASATTTISEDYAALKENLSIFWTHDEKKKNILFNATGFINQHVSMQRLSLRAMIEELLGNTCDIEKGFVEELRKVISSNKGKIQEVVGKDLKMLKKGDKVELACRETF